jgi:NADH-quinone oxidoreductase subunit A
LGWNGFVAVAMFVAFFVIGFTYIFKKGALNWEE